ncbi:MAG: TadE/TadG family type IV pilus assembly protein [bacterium]|nr:TadE/TadG family type IV pilus assembly protein [bacterium]
MKKGKKLVKDTAKILNKKGQALVEFVILLPIIFIIIFAIIDVSLVFYNKNHLEGVLDDVVTMTSNGKSEEEIKTAIDNKDITYTIVADGTYATISLKQKIYFTTPISYSFFKDGLEIETKRVILYEQ